MWGQEGATERLPARACSGPHGRSPRSSWGKGPGQRLEGAMAPACPTSPYCPSALTTHRLAEHTEGHCGPQ